MRARIVKKTAPKGIAYSGPNLFDAKVIKEFCIKKNIPFCCFKKECCNITVKELFENPGKYNIENLTAIKDENFLLLIISGLSDNTVSLFLDYLHKKNIDIPFKCVTTPTNLEWTIEKTYENIVREHYEINGGKKD